MKKWVISKADDSVVNSLSQMCDLSPLALKVVAARGISDLDGLAAFFTDNELSGARKVLTAAAMTYVAALAVSLAQLLRLLIIVAGSSRRRN